MIRITLALYKLKHYPLKIFQHIITIGLEVMKIVCRLPKLDIQEPKKEKAA